MYDARENDIDANVFLLYLLLVDFDELALQTYDLKHSGYSAHKIDDLRDVRFGLNCDNEWQKGTYRCFCSIVFRIRLMRDNSCYRACRNNISSRHLVLPHEMDRELGAIHHTFVVDIGA